MRAVSRRLGPERHLHEAAQPRQLGPQLVVAVHQPQFLRPPSARRAAPVSPLRRRRTVLGEVGHEFGTTTGRPRRCGWLDLVVLRHAQRVNGFTSLALTKLDVLGGLDTISICVGYELDGVEIREMPASASALARCKPVLIDLPGFPGYSLSEWLEMAKHAAVAGSGYSALPENAQRYIAHIEQLLGVPVSSVGVGPDRDATIDATD